jgi:hypothetical protein
MFVKVVRSICVRQVKAAARTPALTFGRWHGVDKRNRPGDVLTVGRRKLRREQDASCIREDMMFRPRSAAIRGIWAGFPHPTALMLAPSINARSQSTRSTSCNCVSKTRSRFS